MKNEHSAQNVSKENKRRLAKYLISSKDDLVDLVRTYYYIEEVPNDEVFDLELGEWALMYMKSFFNKRG